jgi:precorrin-3B synthase
MQTGDGLLVRLTPIGTIALDAFAALCAAAEQHGNGVIEITARGNVQVRGLSTASAPRFAADIAALDIAAADDELFDAGAFAADLRHALAAGPLTANLSPKVSVAIDGGGALNLDQIPADVRATPQIISGKVALKLSVGGDHATAAMIGSVALVDGVDATVALLRVIAQRGRDVRARDIVASEGAGVFQLALRSQPECESPTWEREKNHAIAIGTHRLRDGSFGHGIGLAFGHSDATSLQSLIEMARRVGTRSIRTAPGRALLLIGVPRPDLLRSAAAGLGFIVRSDDPRRAVVACAGAPVCGSAHIASRAIAPVLAGGVALYLDGAFTIHVSGCAKGCAHPGPAALTIVGASNGCALVAEGASRDTPFTTVPGDSLMPAVFDFARTRKRRTGYV